GAVAWYLTDYQGSVMGLADNSGSMLDERSYDAFGNITSETEPSAGDRYGYAGRELDKETGLQNNRGRQLNTLDGYFTSEDPAGFGGGYSDLHVYVGNDSSNLTDPTGMSGESANGASQPGWLDQLRQWLFGDAVGAGTVGAFVAGEGMPPRQVGVLDPWAI